MISLHEVAARAGGRTAVVAAGRRWTYAELAARSEAISRVLESAGVAAGQRVGLMLPNSSAFVASFYAIDALGACVVPLNPAYRRQELRHYCADSKAGALVVAPELVAIAQAEFHGAIVEVDEDGSARARGRAEGAGGDASALLLQYTSGSTGAPKRVIRTHAMLELELKQLADVFALGESDRFLGLAPFTHVNGLIRTMLTSMYVGGTLYPLAELRRREVLDLVTEERLTYFGGVPMMFAVLAETPERGRVDLSSLRVAFSSSAPLRTQDNERFFERYGFYVRQLYGSTETGTISVNLDQDLQRSLDSVGLPLPGVRVEVLEDGEVAVASPWGIEEYAGNPAATAEAFRDGLYHTGDLGRRTEDGSLVLNGRKKFLINRSGFKVNPQEVEQAILTHPKVRQVVVLGAPSPRGDELVRCVATTSGPCTPEEILEHCRGLIADYKIPARIEFRDELPMSPTGKVLRSQL
jgi:long-chain acyl-CoA synthetase